MIVKIGDKVYNSTYQPIMIILDDSEKTLIKDMGEQTKFCSYPQGWKPEKIREFMGVSCSGRK